MSSAPPRNKPDPAGPQPLMSELLKLCEQQQRVDAAIAAVRRRIESATPESPPTTHILGLLMDCALLLERVIQLAVADRVQQDR